MTVSVIGAGLAGCEAAWQLACRGIPVTLHEMKPVRFSPAHRYEGFAELVCSNSLKANRIGSAAGLLKEEMYRLGSIVVRCARETAVPAGGALAVDRYLFSDCITKMVTEHPLITVRREEVTQIPEGTGNHCVRSAYQRWTFQSDWQAAGGGIPEFLRCGFSHRSL